MKFIPYLFKKDLIRLKYLLLVWLLLILAQSALAIGGINLAAEVLQFQIILPLLVKLIGFLQGLMMIVIIPLIIQDDSLVGTTAFWYTRPISRKGLLFAKSCMISTILVMPLLIAELFVLGANGATAYYLLLVVPEVLIEKLAFIVPFVILATLTPKFSRYALVGIIVFAVLVVVAIIKSVIPMFLPVLKKYIYNLELFKNPSLEASVDVAKDLYVFLIGSVLIAHQFLTRHTTKTIKYLVVAFLVMTCCTRLWSWDFLKEASVVQSSPAISDHLSVDFDTQYLIISDEVRYRKKDVREKSISSKQRVKGLPVGQFAILKGMKDVQMKYPDDTILESRYISSFKREMFSSEKFMLPIQAALKDVKLLNPFKEKFSYTEVFSLDESALHQFKNKTGTYSASADFEIYKYEIVSQVPLKQGLKDSFGSEQVVIYDVLERPNVISVIINEKKINLLFDRSVKKTSRLDMAQDIFSEYSPIYLIVNKKRHEAFLPEAGDNLNMNANAMAAFGPTRLETKAKRFDFTNLNDRNELIPEIDKEWLADAELVRMDAVQMATEQIGFTIEDFSLPYQSTATGKEFDELDQQLRMQDKQMKERYTE
ncbi:hypothetical protein ACFL1G_09100 [Planctomycetota bacterium]